MMILFISVEFLSRHFCFARVEWILLESGGIDGSVQERKGVNLEVIDEFLFLAVELVADHLVSGPLRAGRRQTGLGTGHRMRVFP